MLMPKHQLLCRWLDATIFEMDFSREACLQDESVTGRYKGAQQVSKCIQRNQKA